MRFEHYPGSDLMFLQLFESCLLLAQPLVPFGKLLLQGGPGSFHFLDLPLQTSQLGPVSSQLLLGQGQPLLRSLNREYTQAWVIYSTYTRQTGTAHTHTRQVYVHTTLQIRLALCKKVKKALIYMILYLRCPGRHVSQTMINMYMRSEMVSPLIPLNYLCLLTHIFLSHNDSSSHTMTIPV